MHIPGPSLLRRLSVVTLAVCTSALAACAAAAGDDSTVLCTPHFAVAHAPDDGTAADLGNLLETLFDRYVGEGRAAGLGLRAPPKPLRWRCFDRPDVYREYVRREEGGLSDAGHAFYSSRSDCVVLLRRREDALTGTRDRTVGCPDLRRISHEAAHQWAFGTGLQTRGVLYPFWIAEGLAVNMERSSLTQGGLGRDNSYRCGQLIAARLHRRLAPLDDFVILTAATGDEQKLADLYAQAWGTVSFLFGRDPAAFRRYLCLLASRSPGQRPAAALRREFTASFGPIDALQPAWEVFLANISRPGADRLATAQAVSSRSSS